MFISSENRSRHAHIEQAIGGLQDALRSETNRMVFDSRIAAFDTITDSLFVPDIRHDMVRFPRKLADSDKVPVVAISPGQEITAPAFSLNMTPGQMAVARTIAEDWGSTSGQAQQGVEWLAEVLRRTLINQRFSLEQTVSSKTVNAFVGVGVEFCRLLS